MLRETFFSFFKAHCSGPFHWWKIYFSLVLYESFYFWLLCETFYFWLLCETFFGFLVYEPLPALAGLDLSRSNWATRLYTLSPAPPPLFLFPFTPPFISKLPQSNLCKFWKKNCLFAKLNVSQSTQLQFLSIKCKYQYYIYMEIINILYFHYITFWRNIF